MKENDLAGCEQVNGRNLLSYAQNRLMTANRRLAPVGINFRLVRHRRSGRDGCTMLPFFEGKKKTPAPFPRARDGSLQPFAVVITERL